LDLFEDIPGTSVILLIIQPINLHGEFNHIKGHFLMILKLGLVHPNIILLLLKKNQVPFVYLLIFANIINKIKLKIY
jgi:hypothetical protein